MAAFLLSRTDETAELDAALSDATRGEGRVVVLQGPAGIGKTALLDYVRDEAGTRGVRVLTARASALDRAFAHGVVHQLFEPALAGVDRPRRDALLSGAAGRAATLFAGGDAADEPAYAIQHGLYWLTVNLTGDRPLLMLVDDLQWADLPSLRFLEYLGRRLDGLPVTLVATVRTAEPDAPAELLTEIAHGPSARTLSPAPLEIDAVGEVVGGAIGTTPEPGFVRAAWEATGGSPLLVSLLAREAASLRLAGTDDEGARLTGLGAPGVAPAVRRRLQPLGAEAEAVARAVAVAGPRGTVDDIAALTGLTTGTVAAAVERLGAAAVLRPGSRSFVHPLVEAAVLEACPPGVRSRLHRAAADRLRAQGARPAEVALHWTAIDPAGDPQAVTDLLAAAAAAVADDAPETAVAHLRRALAEPPSAERRGRVLLELGELEVRGQLPGGAARLREALTLLPPGNDAARARAALGNELVHNDPVAALAQVRLGLEQATDPVLALRLEAFTLEALIFPDAFAAEREAAFAAGRADPDPSPVMLVNLALAAAGAGRPRAEVRDLAERALAGNRLLDAIGPGNSTWNLLTHALRFAEAPERTRQVLQDGEAHIARHGLSASRFFVDQSFGYWHRDFGSVATGAARGQLCLEQCRELGYLLTIPVVAAIVSENLVHLDRVAEAEAHLDLGPAAETFMEPFILTVRGYSRYLLGRVADAEADLRRSVAFDDRRGWVAPHFTRSALRLAELLAATGRREEALELADRAVAVADAAGLEGPLGMALRARAMAQPPDRAVPTLRAAVDVLGRSPYRLDHGWALHDLGALLLRTDRAAAREPLRLALDAAARTESTRLARHSRTALEAAGVRPRRSHVSGTLALTAAERRVADLAVEGLTNRQIAETLWVTLKTVEIHLSRTYGKLGIGSRRELPTAMGAALR
ncbi:ATP-binding protein [Nakamurella deserti]|uniref:ATP-binding protein n=1 Tax=Nakamurella deserti TaxID=2164074 RepID=UPI000DBE8504|nr:helix-turn-helix transcriptional regulator [Nakamurella deserti]